MTPDASLRVEQPRPTVQTPPRIPYAHRSAYLAEALDSLRRQGQAAGLDIRTPASLGANLLAEALLQYGARRAQAQAAQSTASADQAAPAPAPLQPPSGPGPSIPSPARFQP